MKKILALCSFAAMTVLFVQCAPKKAVTTTEMSDEAKLEEIKENYTGVQLAEGKTIWENSCQKCHKLYSPENYTVRKWENILPRMSKRAKLDDKQSAHVRAYLLTNAKKA